MKIPKILNSLKYAPPKRTHVDPRSSYVSNPKLRTQNPNLPKPNSQFQNAPGQRILLVNAPLSPLHNPATN